MILITALVSNLFAQKKYFPNFADENTVALWLFDETEYPYTTITDASVNHYDLVLSLGGSLSPGIFGHSLTVLDNLRFPVVYAGWAGDVTKNELKKIKDPWLPTVAPENLLKTFTGDEFTIEYWIKFSEETTWDTVTVLDLGWAFSPGFKIQITNSGDLILQNHYDGYSTVSDVPISKNMDAGWHHMAVVKNNSEKKITLFIDGKRKETKVLTELPVQPLPTFRYPFELDHTTFKFTESSPLNWRKQNRFNFSIGQDRNGNHKSLFVFDELRVSDIVRFNSDSFPVPESYSRNYSPDAPHPVIASGVPLLFDENSDIGIVKLSSRKHLFIDDAMISSITNLEFRCNPAQNITELTYGSENDTKVFVPDLAHIRPSILDVDGKVYMYMFDGYGSHKGVTQLRTSENGLHFNIGNWNIFSEDKEAVQYWEPKYATVFEDPNAADETRYKMTGWVSNRGIYLWVSPDGVHWRRNETLMLPLVSGGGAETYWDDQRGLFVDVLKRDASFNAGECPPSVEGRKGIIFETDEVYKPWPFTQLEDPYFEDYPFPSVTCEGKTVFVANEFGDVYRSRPIKYPWAPDTYFSFIWRYYDDINGQKGHKIELGVSRNGINWKYLGADPFYIDPLSYLDVEIFQGMIKRGDEIWQYANFGGKVRQDVMVYKRLNQRLDGFVSIDSGDEVGSFITRQLTFEGNYLELNLNSEDGYALVEFLDEYGTPIPGFSLSACDTIKVDNVHQIVSWENDSVLSGLEGNTISMRIEMQNSKLYAMQFVNSTVALNEDEESLTKSYALQQNYPNPFNPVTAIEFSLAKREKTKLIIYNLLGQEVKELINRDLTAGNHKVGFDATRLTSGVYFYKLESGKFNEVKKMVILK